VTWSTQDLNDKDLVLVLDQESGLPLTSLPAIRSSYHLNGVITGQIVTLQLIHAGTESDTQKIIVPALPIPVAVETPPIQPIQDPTPPNDSGLPPLQDTVNPQQIPPVDSPPTDPNPIPPVDPSPNPTPPVVVVDQQPETPGEVVVVVDPPLPAPEIIVTPTPQPDVVVEPPTPPIVVEEVQPADPSSPTPDVIASDTVAPEDPQPEPHVQNPQTPPEASTPNVNPSSSPVVTPKTNLPAVLASIDTTNTATNQQDEPTNTITTVAGAQDVKTNPQSGVGGVAEVNQLFKGEEIGKQPEAEPSKQANWLLILGIATGILLLVIIGLYLLNSKENDNDES
jgi:hypothetical protein